MSKDLFEKYQSIIDEYNAFPADVPNPFNVTMEEVISETEAVINGKRTILAGTNNYMGMTFNEDAIAAAHKALDDFGTGTTGSRVLNGTYSGHRALEAMLADFYGNDHAMVFSTGYQANLGMITALAGRGDYVIIDADSHASIYDACNMGQADIVRFRHNSPEDLEKRLKRLPADAGKLVVVESIYSMLGDIAPLKELVEISKRYDCTVLVDEAHSMGFFGEGGRGVVQDMGLEDDVDFIVGTFSKSVGTVGGFCVSNHPNFDILRVASRPYMFTASLPPAVVASACASIKVLKDSGSNRRGALWDNANQLHTGLKDAGFKLATTSAESPIIAVIIDDEDMAARFWSALLMNGVYVNMARPPATPLGINLMRCSVCAMHTSEQINQMVATFIAVAKELDLPLGDIAA